jgi:signal peptidase I
MTNANTSNPRPPPIRSAWREVWDIVSTVAPALAIAVAIQTVLFQPFTIPSSSMEPGLVTGDYVIVSKFAYGWSRASLPFDPPLFHGRLFGRDPARGDVVLFRLPRDPRQTWVKRLIGLPGDRVQVRGGTVFVNGAALTQTALGVSRDHDDSLRTVLDFAEAQPNGRRYVTYDGAPEGEGDDTGVYVVPQGSYFVMGDNRDNSLDSRWPRTVGIGFLPAENLVGKAKLVAVSWKAGASLLKPWTWANLQTDRLFKPVR